MLKEPDKDKFVKAMDIEVASMFDENIWISVPKREMLAHHNKQSAVGHNTHRYQIIVIWLFKRGQYPDEILRKYKARL